MNETNLIDIITAMATPLAASLGLDVWGVDAAFGKRGLIRVYVESGDGVDIDKCAELSRLLGLSLDVEDVVPGAYVLEVSSPGLERKFFTPDQLAGYVGKSIDVALHAPPVAIPGRKKFLGELLRVENGVFALLPLDAPKDAPIEVEFVWSDIKKANLVHFLPEAPDTGKGRKPKSPQKRVAQQLPAAPDNEEI